MTDKERKLALYCLKASSDYHSEVCEECINYPNCDHTWQDDVTETIIKALEQEPCDDGCEWFEQYVDIATDIVELRFSDGTVKRAKRGLYMRDIEKSIRKMLIDQIANEKKQELFDEIIDKAVKEIFAQCKQTNPNYSKDWNEGFNDGMFHAITIIKGIRKGEIQ